MAVRVALLALLLAAVLALPAGANAAIVPGIAIDGPSADVQSAWDVDLARDGTGALVYLKKVGGVDHVFVSRYAGGSWQPPEQVDTGVAQPGRVPKVAASDGGRLVVVWLVDMIANDPVRSAIKPSASEPFTQVNVEGNPAHKAVDIEASSSGIAYAVYTSVGGGMNDVRASRLSGTAWTAVGDVFANPGGVLDNDSSKDAGAPDLLHDPRIAVDAAGNAVATWSEEGAAASTYDTYVRRLNGTTRGAIQKTSLDSLDGNPRGSRVDMPDIGIDDAGNAWVVFLEFFTYGGTDRPRILARQLVGDTLGPHQVIDGLALPPTEGSEFPRVDVNGSGQGLAAIPRQLSFQVFGSALQGGTWSTGFPVDTSANDVVAFANSALGETGNGMITWRHSDPPGGNASEIRARRHDFGALATDQIVLSNAAFGSAEQSQLESSADAFGNVAVVFTQGAAADRRVVAAVVDGPPLPPPPDPEPVVTGVAVVPSTFTEGTKLPAILSATGTRINFALSEDARTRLSFELATPGRLVGSKCRKQTRANRKRKKCTRYSKVKTPIDVNAKQGANRVRFQGRLTKNRKLKPGRYRLTVVATDPAGQVSTPKQAKFRMKARKRKR